MLLYLMMIKNQLVKIKLKSILLKLKILNHQYLMAITHKKILKKTYKMIKQVLFLNKLLIYNLK
jgi:ssDNA-specific exonuclease RecJ